MKGGKDTLKNRKKWLWLIPVAAVLVIPMRTMLKDGGTRVYSALTYKVVCWNRITDDGIYKRTQVYPFPLNIRSLGALWEAQERTVAEPEADSLPEETAPEESSSPIGDGQTTGTTTTTGATTDHKLPTVGVRALKFTAQAIRLGYSGDLPDKTGRILRTYEELETFLASVHADAADEKLRENSFDTRAMVAITLTRSSGSDRPGITKVGVFGSSSVKAEVTVAVPPAGTADMAAWLLLAEVDKQDLPAGITAVSADVIEAIATPSREPVGTTVFDTFADGTVRCTPDGSGLRFLCRKGDAPRTVCARDCRVEVLCGGKWRLFEDAAADDPTLADRVAERCRQDAKSGALKSDYYKDGGTTVIRYDGFTVALFHRILGSCPVHEGGHLGQYYEGILFTAGTGSNAADPEGILDTTRCPLEQ